MKKHKIIPEMEGRQAHWYAKNRGTPEQLAIIERQADGIAAQLPQGARVLEVAPGPGYMAIALAKRGLQVTGLDISHTMVDIASTNARDSGLEIDFCQGDAAHLPFPDASFDLIICQAAFKNFTEPTKALDEMYRVLTPGGIAVIHDMRRDATKRDIADEVERMRLSRFNGWVTRFILGTVLRKRSYSSAQLREVVAASAFRTCAITTEGIGLEARMVHAT